MSEMDLDAVVNEWLDKTAEVEKLTTRRSELAAEIIARLGVGGSHYLMPGVGVRVQAGARRFDPNLAVERLTPEQLSLIHEPKLSAALAAKFLPGVLLDMCKSEPGPATVRMA